VAFEGTTRKIEEALIMAENRVEEGTFWRFCVLHRFLHIVVMLGFAGLALTGFSLKFSGHGWAQAIVYLLGGAGNTGYLHRFCAVVTYGCVMVHVLWLVYYKVVLKGSLTGPQSLFPRIKDAKDLWQHIRYFFGRGSVPRFNRFSYWEKFDYLALFIGMNTMGITGVILWFPELFSTVIPGYFINLAQVLHLYEAIMAVALKFVVHILSTHLRPELFPLEKSIFSGKTTEEKMKKEHPGEWEMIQAVKDGVTPESATETS
jgi:cytochrome b subunit of formate dehydrogenase